VVHHVHAGKHPHPSHRAAALHPQGNGLSREDAVAALTHSQGSLPGAIEFHFASLPVRLSGARGLQLVHRFLGRLEVYQLYMAFNF
jgi:hypothetical protein